MFAKKLARYCYRDNLVLLATKNTRMITKEDNSKQEEIKVSISGDNLKYEQMTDLDTAISIINVLRRKNETSPLSGMGSMISTETIDDTAWSALKRTTASTNPEKILALVAFISSADETPDSEVSTDELKEAFSDAGEILPKNLTRDVKKALQYGWVRTGANGLILTQKGREVYKKGFSDSAMSNTHHSAGKRGGKRPVGKQVIRDAVKALNITSAPGDMPHYQLVKTKTDRILWILTFADMEGLTDGLTSGEISYIASELKDNIRSNTITSLTKASLAKAFIATGKGARLKVLQKGISYITDLGVDEE